MSVQLKVTPNLNLIKTNQLEDGQLAIIVNYPSYEGRVVQRIGDRLQTVGGSAGNSWTINGPTFKVRRLEVGETIEVTGN